MRKIVKCRKCNVIMKLNGMASFGGDFSNKYKCPNKECGREAEVREKDLYINEFLYK